MKTGLFKTEKNCILYRTLQNYTQASSQVSETKGTQFSRDIKLMETILRWMTIPWNQTLQGYTLHL